jgi:hypothetical protein
LEPRDAVPRFGSTQEAQKTDTYGGVFLRLMLIRLDNPALADDLCSHFWRAGFAAQPAGGSMVEVNRLDAPSPDQERREIELHLRVWRATNAEAPADIVT